jgi:hypothetical protein
MMEALTSMKRAGPDFSITYFAKEAPRNGTEHWLSLLPARDETLDPVEAIGRGQPRHLNYVMLFNPY